MPTFLFTSCNHQGQKITDTIEAENLPQAKFILETRGHSDIEFFQSELHADVLNTFDENLKKRSLENAKSLADMNASAFYDTRLQNHFWLQFKKIWWTWAAVAFIVIVNPNYFTIGLSVIWILIYTYVNIPIILHHLTMASFYKFENTKSRFWAQALSWFNLISIARVPTFLLDAHLAKLDAREGNLGRALATMQKYKKYSKQ